MKKLLISLCLFVCYSISYGLTLDNLQNRIRFEAGDPVSSIGQWFSTATINFYINDAQLDIVSKTHCLQKIAYKNVSAGTATYILPNDYLKVKRVSFATTTSTDNTKLLYYYDIYGLDSLSEIWESTTTAIPDKYYILGSSICLIPTPNVNGILLKINYVAQPTTLSTGTDYPFNNEFELYPYHRLIISYAVAKLKANRGLYNDAVYYENRYIQEIQLMIQELRSKPDYIPQYGGGK